MIKHIICPTGCRTVFLAFLLSLPAAHGVTLVPIADSFVQDSAAATNFGTATAMGCLNAGTGAGNRDVYLKFDLASVATIGSAKLRFNASFAALGTSNETYVCPVSVRAVADSSWTETGLTWNNRPALGAVVNYGDASGTMPAPTGQWVEIDVTDYLQSQKAASLNVVSVALHNADAFLLFMNVASRESPNPPQLVINTTIPAETDSNYYVAIAGDDANPGTLAQPFRTIQRAASIMIGGDTCYIRAGTYRETVKPANSGTAAAGITFRPYGTETVIISGADIVTGWTIHSGGIYKAAFSGALGNKDQIFVDGQMMNLARWPNSTLDVSRPVKAISATGSFNATANGDGTNTGTYTDPALTQPAGFFNGAKIHFVPGAVWNAQTGLITSYTPGSVSFTWRYSGSTSYAPQASNPYFLFGLLSLLDAPGEWFIDAPANMLYLWPPKNDSPALHVIEARRREVGFDLGGLSYIRLQGLNLFCCRVASTSGCQRLTLDGLTCRYISHFSIIDRGNDPQEDTGIILRGSYHTLSNSEIAYSAGDGVTLWGDHHTVENCVIHDVDYMDGDKGAINTTRRFYSGNDLQSTSTDHQIRYNTFYNSKRALILTGSFRRVSVNHNRLYRSMLGTQDSGAIYTFGHNGDTTELAYNQIHDNVAIFGASAIYLDEGSSNFRVHHNLIYNCYKGLQSNLPSLNILSYNNTSLAYDYSFRTGVSGSQAGTEVRNSIFTSLYNVGAEAVVSNNLQSNQDPQFVSPATLDFRIQSTSPAHDAGMILPPYTDGFEGAAPDIGALEYGQSYTVGASLATGIPAGPTGLTAILAGTQVQLTWTDNSGGTVPQVIERTLDYHTFTELTRLPKGTITYTDTTAVVGTYYYRVRSGESPYSNYASISILGRDAFSTIQAEVLDSSSGITINSATINPNVANTNWAKYGSVNFGNGANQFTLRMTNFSGLTTNFLEVHLGSPTGTLIANINILGSNGVPTTLTGPATLTSGVQDIYLVFKGSLSWFLDYFSFIPASALLPSPPTALTAQTVSQTTLQLAWTTPVGGADGIKIERSSDNQLFVEIATLGGGTTTYADTSLPPGTTFFYRIRAFKVRGFSDYSAFSFAATVADTAPPLLNLPANITAEATMSSGRVVTFVVSATDDLDAAPSVIATPASGTVFSIGTTVVNVTAADASGNAANGSFTVKVQDTTAPTITINLPTTDADYLTTNSLLTLSGADADAVGVTQVDWSNDRGGNGTATLSAGAWSAAAIPLQYGMNVLAVTIRDEANNTSTATLIATRQTYYEAWAAQKSLTGPNADPLMDYNHNKVINLLEYAFGTDPVAEAGDPRLIRVAGGNIIQLGGPTTLVINAGTGDVRAIFGRRKDAAEAGLIYSAEFSADLSHWTPGESDPTVVADDGNIEAVTVPFPSLAGEQPARFFRVRVTSPWK